MPLRFRHQPLNPLYLFSGLHKCWWFVKKTITAKVTNLLKFWSDEWQLLLKVSVLWFMAWKTIN